MKKPLFALLVIIIFITACGEPDSAGTADNSSDATAASEEETSTVTASDDDQLYAWVQNLNVRATPSTKGEVVTIVQPTDALEVVERSAKAETIVLRGVMYEEPWIKVKTPNGAEGWVFGGALKREDEQKGNAVISKKKFAFPVFGEYDLDQWQKLATKPGEDEGDFDTETSTYKRGKQLLEIYSYDGEYGYGHIYKLKTSTGKVLKERHFSYSNDAREITETILDFTADPPREYSRSQPTKMSSFQLTSRPLMLTGPWTEKGLDDDAQAGTSSGRIGLADFCGGLDPEDTGCSCSFRLSADDYKSTALYADYVENACVSIDGKSQSLKGFQQSHGDLNNRDPWIVLNDDKSTLFNDPHAPFGNYDLMVELLTQALLSLDRIPDAVPIQNNMTAGMLVREVRDMSADAVSKARQLRKNGVQASGSYYHYENNQFIVTIKANEDKGARADSGIAYKGEMTVTTKDGTLVDKRTVWGHCGC